MARTTQRNNRITLLALGVATALGVLGATSSAFAQSYEMRFPYLGLAAPSSTTPPEDPDTGGAGGGATEPDPTIPVSLTLASAALPNALVGQPYSFDFGSLLTIEGDNPPALSAIYWPAVTGLPPGLTLTDTGVLTGTPTVRNSAGASFEVVAQHEDAEGRRVFTIIVDGVPVTLTLASATLPNAMVGSAYNFDFKTLLTIEGDDAPAPSAITWPTVTGLPAGLSLSETGVLSGTPTTKNEAGASFEVVAQHEDAEGRQVFTIVVNGAVLQVTQISVGDSHTCAVTTAGAAKCWGDNTYHQLGDGTTVGRLTPVTVSGLGSGVARISAGNQGTCAVTTSGAAKCWGQNLVGQLGDGTITNRATPVNVSGLGSGVARIVTMSDTSCAVTTAGAAYCWGSNTAGKLGNNSGSSSAATPVAVSGLGSGVADISLGRHACAVTTSGAVSCWGYNYYGQLGDGTTTHRYAPVPVSGLSSGVARISVGDTHTCAITTAGAVKCWGRNAGGQLGDGSLTDRRLPVDVSGLGSGVASISAGSSHTCAVTTAGAAKCWGSNNNGQLGDGTTTSRSTPVTVSSLDSGVASISAGGVHTCAVTTSGGAKCWGYSLGGRLGIGTTTGTSSPPVDVLP